MKIDEVITLVKECGLNIETTKHHECEKVVLNALEKQIPKKVEEYLTSSFCCPVCTNVLSRYSIYCSNCGQALDWSDTNG